MKKTYGTTVKGNELFDLLLKELKLAERDKILTVLSARAVMDHTGTLKRQLETQRIFYFH